MMSNSVAVFHGAFGRVCLFDMDRRMVPHGHREGHVIFHVQGPPGEMVVGEEAYPISPGQAVAVSPWQTHYYRPVSDAGTTLALVLYIRPGWFLEAARAAAATLAFGRSGIEVTDQLARLVYGTAQTMIDPDTYDPLLEERVCDLTQLAYDQSWQWTPRGRDFTGPEMPRRDYRIRNALRILQARLGETVDLDGVAREVGLSRPHFYKLFRAQVGLTPNLYLNALRMESAIDRLAETREAVTEIGFDHGFSSQASFSRFFIANGVVPPSDYRRSVCSALLG
jgi:AraC-like DNA-binding protein